MWLDARMRSLPVALTIGGSDSGGGAGIQADLKTFAALDAHGASVVTCLTAQNPKTVLGVRAVEAEFVRLQLEAVFGELRPAAVKTGMLFSAEIIRTVREFFEGMQKKPSLVIDPVTISTSGARLLEGEGLEALKEFGLATLITPNVDEASALLDGMVISTPEELRLAARELHRTMGCAVLAKGGHLNTGADAIDFFYDGKTELILSAPRVRGVRTHGTGCTYSAAIAAYLARGMKLEKAVVAAKSYVSRAIAGSTRIGKRHQALGWHCTGGPS
jgi:hydroxymethylpyrimidine/phosphomethylpyrimidine kinase